MLSGNRRPKGAEPIEVEMEEVQMDLNDDDVLATLHAIFKEQPELWRHSPAVIPSTVVPAGVTVRADTEATEPIAA